MRKCSLAFAMFAVFGVLEGFAETRVKNNEALQRGERFIVKFKSNKGLKEKREFFRHIGIRPILFNVFGYDIGGCGFKKCVVGLSAIKKAALKNGLVLEKFYFEKKMRINIKKYEFKPIKQFKRETKRNIPWYSGLIGKEDARRFLRKESVPLGEEGVVIVDLPVNIWHPDISKVLKKDKNGAPIFWINSDKKTVPDDHGTHVACLAAGYNDNRGIDGLAGERAYILPLMIDFEKDNYIFISDIVLGLYYYYLLERQGVINFRVVNMSFSLYFEAPILYGAMNAFKDKIFVVSAGNNGRDVADGVQYPASWKLENKIVVAASDENDHLAPFSNYSEELVPIAAPGDKIISCGATAQHVSMSGTSMSSSLVAGALTLLFSMKPDLTVGQAKKILLYGANTIDGLKKYIVYGRRLNINSSARLLHFLMKRYNF